MPPTPKWRRADAIAFNGTSTSVLLSNGSGFGAPTPWSSGNFYGGHDAYSTMLGDVNGDRIADAVAFDGATTRVVVGVR
jgi:hypothetical protein